MSSDLENTKPTKTVVYRKINGHQGIKTIWDWSQTKQAYVQRTKGLKFYAHKKCNGLQRAKSFSTFDEARRWRGAFDKWDNDDIDLMFPEVMSRYFDYAITGNRLRTSTLDTYQSKARHLQYFARFKMSEITPKLIDQWLYEIKQPRYLSTQHKSRSTYRHELSLLRQITSFYREYLSDNYQVPVRRRHNRDCIIDLAKYQESKSKNKFKYIPRAELDRFYDMAHELADASPKYKIFAYLAFIQANTGMRIGEACALDWKDIDFTRQMVSITKTVSWSRKKGRETTVTPSTKTGDSRIIPVTEMVIDAFREIQTYQKRHSGKVFSKDGFSVLSYRSIQYFYNKVFQILGISWRSTHIMRHSFATDFLEATNHHSALQQIMGHRNLSQTEHYAKITDSLSRVGVNVYQGTFKNGRVKAIEESEALPVGRVTQD